MVIIYHSGCASLCVWRPSVLIMVADSSAPSAQQVRSYYMLRLTNFSARWIRAGSAVGQHCILFLLFNLGLFALSVHTVQNSGVSSVTRPFTVISDFEITPKGQMKNISQSVDVALISLMVKLLAPGQRGRREAVIRTKGSQEWIGFSSGWVTCMICHSCKV